MAEAECPESLTDEEKTLESLGDYLTSQYGILRRVFSYLSIYDLARCECVCQDWKEAATVTRKERRRIQCLTFHKQQTEPHIFSDARMTLSFCTAPISSDNCALLSEEGFHFHANYGIISVIDDSKPVMRRTRVELPLTPRPYLLTAVRFPPAEGVVMRSVTFNTDPITTSYVEESLRLPNDIPIKAMILIVFDEREIMDHNLVTILTVIEKRQQDYAIGGCRLMVMGGEGSASGVQIILFGGPNLEAASCVLDNNCRTQKIINSRVEQMSKDVVHAKSSALIAFRCCDRQKVRRRYNYLPRENVETWETDAVKTFFPSTPVIGCYGIGEFGSDYPRFQQIKRQRRNEDSRIEFSFSTILLYIGFNNKTRF